MSTTSKKDTSPASYEDLQTRVSYLEELLHGDGEQKNLEHRLVFLTHLLHSLPTPVFFKNSEGCYLDCNQAFAETILGIQRSQLVGKSLFDLPEQIPQALAEIYKKADDALFASRGTQFYESQVKRADGTLGHYIFYKAVIELAASGEPGIIGIMLDISDRKEVEAKLQESEQRNQALLNATSAGMGIHDKGTILVANEGLSKLTGYSMDELAGMNGIELFGKTEHSKIKQRIESPDQESLDSKLQRKDGTTLDVEVRGQPIMYLGRKARVVEIRDLSERLRMQAEREQLIVELQSALDNIKVLRGLLPICSKCKKIRDDSGFWQKLENYLQSHTEVSVTHGICPECIKDLYGQEAWFKEGESKT